jgi:flagellar operon protein
MSNDLKLGSLSADVLRDRIAASTVDSIKKSSVKDSAAVDKTKDQNFENELKKTLEPKLDSKEELKFSAHAKSRLTSRGIELTPDEIVRMQEAIQKMGEKGSKESLILTDKAAFVVSVKNNTVITAVDKDSMKENVFTNIDSTIMI